MFNLHLKKKKKTKTKNNKVIKIPIPLTLQLYKLPSKFPMMYTNDTLKYTTISQFLTHN